MARKKFTLDDHDRRMKDIINRPKQTTDRRGTLRKLLETAKAKRARV